MTTLERLATHRSPLASNVIPVGPLRPVVIASGSNTGALAGKSAYAITESFALFVTHNSCTVETETFAELPSDVLIARLSGVALYDFACTVNVFAVLAGVMVTALLGLCTLTAGVPGPMMTF